MRRILRRLLLSLPALAAGLFPAGATSAAGGGLPHLAITATDPAPAASLGQEQAFSVRIAYRSSVPVRFELRAFSAGKSIADVSNPKPLYPPTGDGEAIAWIAFRKPVTVDRVEVRALAGDWQPLAQAELAVQLQWTGEPVPHRPQQAPWVDALNREQQATVAATMSASSGGEDLGAFEIYLGFGVILGYLFLQPFVALRWAGRWRGAGLLPLLLTVPLAVYTVAAMASGSNLWPLLALFLMPLAFVYLVCLVLLRMLLDGRQTA